MTTWSSTELNKIGAAEELEIESLRRDGALRKPLTIGVVRVGDNLFVRSYRGRNGTWFCGALVRHEGHIQAGGVNKDVAFVKVPELNINDQIDAAYRTKYRKHEALYVDPLVAPAARAATIKLVPHD